jgi:Ser/Thr protein kinase RdoA (MazF antagonist)
VVAPVDVVSERIGAWIRTYQRVIDAEGVLCLDERRDYLEVRVQRLLAAGIFTEPDGAAVLARFDALASSIDPASLPLVAIHADLNPSNILVTPQGGVTILDFAMAKTGARVHDLAHLYMHLEFIRWRPRLKSSIVDDVQAALLRGFNPGSSPSDPLFQLMLLQHLVCHVALLAERPRRPLDPASRWFIRRRWARCARMQGLEKPGRRSGSSVA